MLHTMSAIYPILKDVILGFSVLLNLYIVFKLVQMRDIISAENLRLFRQVKTMWGKNQANVKWSARDKSAAYKSGQIKFTEKLKSIIPLGMLDELTPEEMQEYILNPEMIEFFIRARSLIGGGFETLQGLLSGVKMPQLPGREKKRSDRPGAVPKMSRSN